MTQKIDISSDSLHATILSTGAALVAVRFTGQSRNMVLGFDEPLDHARIPAFAGHLAGPVANRVRDGKVVLEGQTYTMPLNEDGITTLHSGPDGLHAQEWGIVMREVDCVTLACTLADGCNGLPGTRRITARYQIEGSTLRLTIEATSDTTTLMNIAAHPYWNLDGSHDVSGHTLRIAAHSYLPTDARNLPTGQIASVNGTLFDFQKLAPVPLDPSLDVNFCLATTMRPTPQCAASLRGSDGTRLDIATTCPGMQVYSGAHLPRLPTKMADFPPLAPYAGIALEPQHWPDAAHHTHFPSITLRPGETYRQITEYHLIAP